MAKKTAVELPKGYTLENGFYRTQFVHQGKRYRFSNKNLSELKKEVEARKYEIKNGLYEQEKRITCDAFFEIWITTYKTNIKRGSVSTYRQVWKNLLRDTFGKRQMKDLRGDTIQAHINRLVSDGNSYSRINLAMIILNGMFRQAKMLHYINASPMDAVTMPSKSVMAHDRGEDMQKVKAMSMQEKDTFLAYAKDSKYLNFYIFALNTGCRIGEALALKWQDVDFAKKEIHINGTLEYIRGTGRTIEIPKTKGSRRTIPMTSKLYDLLLQVRKEQIENRSIMGKHWKEETGLENIVLTYAEGGAFWDTSIRVDINNIVKRIKRDGHEILSVTPHTFRHTFATLALANGMRPKDLQVILGHSNFSITMDIYAEVLADSKREAMAIIDNVM